MTLQKPKLKITIENDTYVEKYKKINIVTYEHIQLLESKKQKRKTSESDFETIEKFYFKNIIKNELHINIESSLFYLYYKYSNGKNILNNLYNEANFQLNYEKNIVEKTSDLIIDTKSTPSMTISKIKKIIEINKILGFKSSTDTETHASVENIELFRENFKINARTYYTIFGVGDNKLIDDAVLTLEKIKNDKSKFNKHVYDFLQNNVYSMSGMKIQSERDTKKSNRPLLYYALISGENLFDYMKVVENNNNKTTILTDIINYANANANTNIIINKTNNEMKNITNDEIKNIINNKTNNEMTNITNDEMKNIINNDETTNIINNDDNVLVIYVLLLDENKYYVGKTNNLSLRILQHNSSNGSSWTKKYKPIKIVKTIRCNDKFDEDKYTLEYMEKYGILNVRGGSFCDIMLSSSVVKTITKMINTSLDKCFICGNIGHFAHDCKSIK